MGTIQRSVAVMAACLLALALAGCEDPHAEDKTAIRAAVKQLDDANEACDGEAAVAVMSSAALDQYSQIVQLALNGTEREVRGLKPTDLGQVIALRHRMTRKELEGMDGRAYQAFATSACWYSGYGEEYAWATSMGAIRVVGDYAYVDIVDDRGRKTGYEGRFEREGGAWKINEFSFHPHTDALLYEDAEFEGMSIEELLIWMEEDDSGEPVGEEIWQPMR